MKRILSLLLALLATSAMGADLRSAGIKGATTSTPCPGCVGENYQDSWTYSSSGNATNQAISTRSLSAGIWMVTVIPAMSSISTTASPTAFTINAPTTTNTYGKDYTTFGFSLGNATSLPGMVDILTVTSTTTVTVEITITTSSNYTTKGTATYVRIY